MLFKGLFKYKFQVSLSLRKWTEVATLWNPEYCWFSVYKNALSFFVTFSFPSPLLFWPYTDDLTLGLTVGATVTNGSIHCKFIYVYLLDTLVSWFVILRSQCKSRHEAVCDSVWWKKVNLQREEEPQREDTCHCWYLSDRRCALNTERHRKAVFVCVCMHLCLPVSVSSGYVMLSLSVPFLALIHQGWHINLISIHPLASHIHTLYPLHNVIPFLFCIFFHLPPLHLCPSALFFISALDTRQMFGPNPLLLNLFVMLSFAIISDLCVCVRVSICVCSSFYMIVGSKKKKNRNSNIRGVCHLENIKAGRTMR